MTLFSILLLTSALAIASPTNEKSKPLFQTRRQLEERIRQLDTRLDSAIMALGQKDSLTAQLREELEQAYTRLEELSAQQEDGLNISPTLEQIDSNLNIWALSRQLDDFDPLAYEPDFRGEQADSVYIARLEQMNSPLNLPYNEIVRSFIVKYSERYRSQMQKILGLGSYYFPIFEESFDRYGLPLELEAMAIIESNLNPRAKSPAGAVGLWQFTFNAGRAYGLQIDSFI